MNRVSMAFACVAGVIACQAGLADGQPVLYFGKANVSDEEVQRDHDACSHKATTPVWRTAQTQPGYTIGPSDQPLTGPPQGRGVGTVTILDGTGNVDVFVQCMLAKGYKQGLPPMPSGKPGLYEFRKSSNAVAQPGQVFQLCVPPDGTKLLAAMAGLNPGCTYSNVMGAPHGFSADAVCQSDQRLHVAFEATTPDRRAFTVNQQSMPGAIVSRVDRLQIDWVSGECGDIPPGSVRTPDGRLVTVAKP